ncbi:MAG: hypothetical protein AB7V18_19360 [Pyrinomonadaceae bacterium]
MCKEGYAIGREKEIQDLVDKVLDLGETSEGACLVMSLIEAEATFDVVHSFIKYITVLRYKILRAAGDRSLSMEQIEAQVSTEIVARAARRLKGAMAKYENPVRRN